MILQKLVVFVVLILGASGLSFAQSAKPAGLESLQGYVCKYPTDVALWEKEPLQSRLKALLGARYSTFVANTTTNSPVARYGDVMWTSGNKPHAGGSDAALFLADIKANVIEVYVSPLQRCAVPPRGEGRGDPDRGGREDDPDQHAGVCAA